jgi:AraC-like DNA-binding protein
MAERHARASGSHAGASAVPAGETRGLRSTRLAPDAGDPLSVVLDTIRLSGAMLFLVEAAPPWVTEAPDGAAFAPSILGTTHRIVSYHIVLNGSCWAGLIDGEPERFDAGDILLIPHGDPYLLASAPDLRASYGRDDSVRFLVRMARGELPPVIVEDGGGAGATRFICGFLGCDDASFEHALCALPRMVHLRRPTDARDPLDGLIDFALGELRTQGSGASSVLLRLSELVFVGIIRRYLAAAPAPERGWLAGLRDPVVARAMTIMHTRAADPWTLAALSREAGASRSTLVERFTTVVGEPPMQYLARWRMQLAARMLTDESVKVATVAASVGYQSEAAFSRAFKRAVGVAPMAWRDRERTGRSLA